MIPIEQQVVSRELAERMVRLGAERLALAAYMPIRWLQEETVAWELVARGKPFDLRSKGRNWVPAYSASELYEMFGTVRLTRFADSVCEHYGGRFEANYGSRYAIADTAADALALLWLALHTPNPLTTDTEN
jgi:hypothetical protein